MVSPIYGMWKYFLVIPVAILFTTMFLTFDFGKSNSSQDRLFLPTASTKVNTYPDYVTEDCHPDLTPEREYYDQCPPFSFESEVVDDDV